MTRRDVVSTHTRMAGEFHRLHHLLAGRLTPAEDRAFTALGSALETTIDALSLRMADDEGPHCWHTRWDLDGLTPPVECCRCGLMQG